MQEFVIELSPYDSKYMRALNVHFSQDMARLPGRDFVSTSIADAIKIKRKIAGNILLIERNKIEKQVGKLQNVSFTDFITRTSDSFENLKHKYVVEINSRINFIIATISALEIYEYFMCVIGLAENGFIITDSDREDKYIEIINTGREELIDLLEIYLDNKENIDQIYQQYKRFKDIRNAVSRSSSVEELNDIIKNASPSINLQEQVKIEE